MQRIAAKTADVADRPEAKVIWALGCFHPGGEMYIDSTVSQREAFMRAGSGELAEGLLLLRASTLKLIRLHLAVERCDRTATLAAIDDLVTLDGRLQDCLDAIPGIDHQELRRALVADRFALSQEKLTLAAGIRRRPVNPIEDMQEIDEAAWLEEGGAWAGRRPGRSRWMLAIASIFILCLTAAACFISVPDAATWLAGAAGAVR
jgi:hypothetical protein